MKASELSSWLASGFDGRERTAQPRVRSLILRERNDYKINDKGSTYMRKHLSLFIVHCSLIIALMSGLTSCAELFDMEEAIVPTTMTLERHDVTLMVGDSCVIHPVFTPDSLSNNSIFWFSMDNQVADFVTADTLVALGTGVTDAVAISVTDYTQVDTCAVRVIDRWELTSDSYPYEMVIYARAIVQGQPITPDMTIAAFYGEECRGIGQVRQSHGITYLVLRVGSEIRYDDSDEDWIDYGDDEEASSPSELYRERIIFRCYDRRNHILLTSPVRVVFDGEAHGTLSDLFDLEF